jgi:hypothetical protein
LVLVPYMLFILHLIWELKKHLFIGVCFCLNKEFILVACFDVPRFVVLLDVLASVQISCDPVSFAVCFSFFHRVTALLSYHNVNRSFGILIGGCFCFWCRIWLLQSCAWGCCCTFSAIVTAVLYKIWLDFTL